MDKYYGNVCELDIIFNFQKAYFILDELLLAGEMQESSKKNVLRVISQQDSLEDMEVSNVPSPCKPIPLPGRMPEDSYRNTSQRNCTLNCCATTNTSAPSQVEEEVTKIM